MRFTHRRALTSDLFDSPSVVDSLIAQMEQELLLHAWREGWLPDNITWEMWVECPEWSDLYMPIIEARMTSERQRA